MVKTLSPLLPPAQALGEKGPAVGRQAPGSKQPNGRPSVRLQVLQHHRLHDKPAQHIPECNARDYRDCSNEHGLSTKQNSSNEAAKQRDDVLGNRNEEDFSHELRQVWVLAPQPFAMNKPS
jgi:hypothetical protein